MTIAPPAMNDEPNPYAPPRADAPSAPPRVPKGPLLQQFVLLNAQKATWTLAIHTNVVRLVPADAQAARAFDRPSFIKETTLNFFLGNAQLLVPKPAPAIALIVTPDALSGLRAWLGPALREHMARVLGQQRPISLLLGLMWMFPGARGAQPLPIAFGAAWIAWAAAATLRPHRVLFLVNAALWVGAAASIVIGVVNGTTAKWLLGFLIFFWPMLAMRVRCWRFYAPSEPRA
jgi:hypothetical protein